jgi:hypothetical protein
MSGSQEVVHCHHINQGGATFVATDNDVREETPGKTDVAAAVLKELGVCFAESLGPVTFRCTGLRDLDRVLGGGWVAGGINELGGDEEAAMRLAMLSAARIIRAGGAAITYAPYVLSDDEACAQIGAPKKLITVPDVFAAPGLTRTFATVRALAETAPMDLVIIHVPSLISQHEADADFGDGTSTDRAKIVTDAIRKAAPTLLRCRTSMILVNGDVTVGRRGGETLEVRGVGGSMRKLRARRMVAVSPVKGSRVTVQLLKGSSDTSEVVIDLKNPPASTDIAPAGAKAPAAVA